MARKVSEMSEKEIQALLKYAQANDYRVRGHTAATASSSDWSELQAGFVPNYRPRSRRRGFVMPGAVKLDPVKAFGQEQALAKRTPQERLDSMASRLWRQAQTTPELYDKLMRDIQGELWRQGKMVTYEEVRQVAAQFLVKAEKEK